MTLLRVVFLVGELGLGGSERQLVRLLCAVDRKVIEPVVVVFNQTRYQPLDEVLLAAGVEVITLPKDCRGVLARFGYLVRLFRNLRPQVVHSWTTHDNPYAGLAGWLAGIPVRWGSLRGSLRLSWFAGLPGVYRWLAVHSVQRLTVNAVSLKDELIQAGLPGEKVSVLPNCVQAAGGGSAEARAEMEASLGIAPEAVVVGLVGNLRPVKNHELFIAAMARVLPDFPAACALLIGQPIPDEPVYPARLAAQIEVVGMQGRILLAGFRPDVPAVMERLDILCLTSHSEGVPNVILEAMAAGKPVVATRVGGVQEVVEEGVTGYLVSSGDEEGLAARVQQLLEDAELRDRMGQAGRKRVEEYYECAQLAGRLVEMYHDAISHG